MNESMVNLILYAIKLEEKISNDPMDIELHEELALIYGTLGAWIVSRVQNGETSIDLPTMEEE